MKRWLFIPVLIILLMSHNAGALSTTLNLDDYEMKAVVRGPGLRCGYNDGTFDNDCKMTNANGVAKYFTSISFERSVIDYAFKAGDIVEFDFTFYNDSLSSVFSSGSYNFGILDFLTNSSSFQVISIQEYTDDAYQNVSGDYDITTSILMTKRYHFTLMVWTDYTGTLSFNRPNLVNWVPAAERSSISLKASNYIVYRKKATGSSQDQKNEINATEDAVDDGEDASDNAQDSVNGASSTLLANIGNIIGAIKDTPASDCYIDVSTRQFSVGNLNLCQGVPYSILNSIRVLAALVITPMVLRACYVIVRSMIDKFHEVQDT